MPGIPLHYGRKTPMMIRVRLQKKLFWKSRSTGWDSAICPPIGRGSMKKNVDYILRTLTQMKEFLDARNIKLDVGIYPDEFQVNEALLFRIFQTFNLEKDQFEVELPQRLLAEHCVSGNIEFMDLLDSFRREGAEKPLYLNRDSHWNPAGNELAADVLFRFLAPQIDAAFTAGKTE